VVVVCYEPKAVLAIGARHKYKNVHVFDHGFSVLGVSQLKRVRIKCIGSML